MMLLTKAKIDRTQSVVYNVGTMALWAKFLRYNLDDVEILRELWTIVDPGWRSEASTLQVHSEINTRGWHVNRNLAERLMVAWKQSKANAVDRIAELTSNQLNSENIRSGPKVHSWLNSQGIFLKSLRRDELEMMFVEPEEFFSDAQGVSKADLIVEVLSERINVVQATDAKLPRLLSLVEKDDRVRNLFVAWGANTGRFSGRIFQPHNLPRGVHIDNLEELLSGNNPTLPDEAESLKTLLRPCLNAEKGKTLVIADYGAVEGRGVAWLADEPALMATYNDPKGDPYLTMASTIYGRTITAADKAERQVGKMVVLGCGYGMGVDRFADSCKRAKVDLEKAGVTADECVQAFRTGHKAIPTLWADLNAGVFQAYRDGYATVRMLEIVRESTALTIRLPSGRRLYYPDPIMAKDTPRFARLLGQTWKTDVLTYLHPHGYRKEIYGGLLTENVVQAICRDLLAYHLQALSAKGYPIVGHVHDEIVIESDIVEHKADDIATIMSTGPEWAAGFPVAVSVFVCPWYIKEPFSSCYKVKAHNGQINVSSSIPAIRA